MTSEHSKPWNHVRHLHVASEGLRKDGDHSSARRRERKVERKKKEASSASSDPGEELQKQGESQEKEEEGASGASGPGEGQQNQDEGQEKEEEGVSAASGPGEEQQNQDEGQEKEEEGLSVASGQGEEQRDKEDGQEEEKQEGVTASSEPEKEQRDQDESQERSPSLSLFNTLSEGVDKERLGQLRSQLQAQFSIQEQQEDQSPGSQLEGRIIHREGDDGALPANREVIPEGQCPTCGQCSNPAGCSSGLPTEVEKTLQRELAVLKGEVTASIESMRREVAEELSSLREALQVYNEHHFFQAADLSPLEELDENVPNHLKGGPHMIPQAGKPGDKISLEEQFKSRSVPTLHPLPISSRNQAMLRAAMTTITAKSGFGSNLSRSNSDPVEPMQAKSTIFPPAVPKLAARKLPAKVMAPPAPRTYASNGKYSNKMSTRTLAPHLPCGDCEGRPH